MGKQTPFYVMHVKANAKIVDFAGWDMPLHYGSQIEEHHQVRKHVGMFDVSHMGVVDLHGSHVIPFLRYLLANNVDKLNPHQALYTCMLNEAGGVIDDLIVYKIEDHFFRLVINAGTREKDLAWINKHAHPFDVKVTLRTDLVMLAIQGPEALDKLKTLLPQEQALALSSLKPFHFLMTDQWFVARTGYTGEDGVEIIFPAESAEAVWQSLLSQQVKPCGLGARDTLRLEAGLNLYGADMDETITPYEANLAWTVSLDTKAPRDFIGRDRLNEHLATGIAKELVGLILTGPGVIRNHQKVWITNDGVGEVTSGGYSPTLGKSIALARIPARAQANEQHDATCYVEIRKKKIPAQIVKPPFVRRDKKKL